MNEEGNTMFLEYNTKRVGLIESGLAKSDQSMARVHGEIVSNRPLGYFDPRIEEDRYDTGVINRTTGFLDSRFERNRKSNTPLLSDNLINQKGSLPTDTSHNFRDIEYSRKLIGQVDSGQEQVLQGVPYTPTEYEVEAWTGPIRAGMETGVSMHSVSSSSSSSTSLEIHLSTLTDNRIHATFRRDRSITHRIVLEREENEGTWRPRWRGENHRLAELPSADIDPSVTLGQMAVGMLIAFFTAEQINASFEDMLKKLGVDADVVSGGGEPFMNATSEGNGIVGFSATSRREDNSESLSYNISTRSENYGLLGADTWSPSWPAFEWDRISKTDRSTESSSFCPWRVLCRTRYGVFIWRHHGKMADTYSTLRHSRIRHSPLLRTT